MFLKTRREFLQLSAGAATAATLARGVSAWGEIAAAPNPVKLWITSEAQRFSPSPGLKWTGATSEDSESVRIDPTTWFQEILGFGGAFTDASSFLFSQLSPRDRTSLFNELSAVFAGVLKNWGCSIVGWNLALDESGKPNTGPGQSGGIVTIHSRTQEITQCGQYWAFAHFSKVMERGARCWPREALYLRSSMLL